MKIRTYIKNKWLFAILQEWQEHSSIKNAGMNNARAP